MVWSILIFLHLFSENVLEHTQIKTLNLVRHSEKSTFLCPFLPGVFSNFGLEHGGCSRGPSIRRPPPERLVAPCTAPSLPAGSLTAQTALCWESLSGYSLSLSLMCSGILLYRSTTPSEHSPFSDLTAAKYLWTHPSFSLHTPFVKVHTCHPFHCRS